MRNFEKDWKFTIYKNFTLSSEDREVLSLLYLPIIKKDAYSLYSILYDLKSYEEENLFINGDNYFSLLGFDSTSFLDALRHLEGLNLLITYKRNKIDNSSTIISSYVFKLLPVASAFKFFNDGILRSLLVNVVSNKEYMKLKNHFKINESKFDDSFINISSEFKEVYNIPSSFNDSILKDDFSDKKYIKESLFTKDELLKKLEENKIESNEIKTHLDDIISLSSLYGISLDDILNLVISNMSSEGKFYFDKFQESIKNFHSYNSLSNYSNSKNNNDVQFLKYIKAYEKFSSVEDFLASKQNKKPSKVQLDTINDLKINYKFSNIIIEIIIDYCLNHTSNSFNVEYITKVSDSIKLNKIDNPYDVMEYLLSWDSKSKKVKKNKSVKKNAGIEMVDLTDENKDDDNIIDLL